jgi:hypothetical protein
MYRRPTDMNMTPLDPRRSVWLHVHVPKAGGSTLRHLFRRNFDKGYYNATSLLETKQYSRDEVAEIVCNHPHVRCYSDHKLSLDLPFDLPQALLFAVCFVRDPVERFISRYFFHRHFEEVQCIAQQVSFREFAEAELVRGETHPSTNSQINFLSGGRSNTDLTLVQAAIDTGRAFLFPVERFDEACICLEKVYPDAFSDLSYVLTNVSRKDEMVTPENREFIRPFLASDLPLIELAHEQLDHLLKSAFASQIEGQTFLAEFRDRCSRRYDNFYPPRPAVAS